MKLDHPHRFHLLAIASLGIVLSAFAADPTKHAGPVKNAESVKRVDPAQPVADELVDVVVKYRIVTDSGDFSSAAARDAAQKSLANVLSRPQLPAAIALLKANPNPVLLQNLMIIVRRATEDNNQGLHQQLLLQSLGFERLESVLGLPSVDLGDTKPNVNANAAVGSLYTQLRDYDRDIVRQLQIARQDNRFLRESLIRQQRALERGMFVVNLLAMGAAFGAFGYYGGPLLGMDNSKLVGMLGGSWAATSVFEFEVGWPLVRNFLIRALPGYWRTREHFIDMLKLHADRAAPLVLRFAETEGDARMSPLQQAAYSALMSTKDSSVNRALSDLGAADLRAKNYTRARKIFKEIAKRDPAGLGKSAAAILKVLDAGDAYHSAKFWFQARYIGKNALRTGGLLVAGIGATYAFVPHALIFYTAIYGGMGLAGARNILGRLWWKFPEAKMRAYLAGYHRNYVKALSDAIALAPPNVARELQFLRDRLETNDRERSDAEFQDERVEEALCPLDLRALAPAEELVEDGGPP